MRTNIERLRKERGLTQEALAAAVGVTRQTIISLEQARYNPSLRLAYQISKALRKKSIEEVFEFD